MYTGCISTWYVCRRVHMCGCVCTRHAYACVYRCGVYVWGIHSVYTCVVRVTVFGICVWDVVCIVCICMWHV